MGLLQIDRIDHQIYRNQCATMNKLLQQTRVCYYSEKVKSSDHDQKSIYKISKLLMVNGEGHSLPSGIPAKN